MSGYETVSGDEPIEYSSIANRRFSSYIIMGKDKNLKTDDETGNITLNNESGYQAGAIDIFVGLNKLNNKKSDSYILNESGEKERLLLNSDFSRDAARIYISELSDPDIYFNIKSTSLKWKPNDKRGTFTPRYSNSSSKVSTVTILSDATRIIGRNSVKIVTKSGGELLSNSKPQATFGGIHLIAGNDPDTLQPMVKGDTLEHELRGIATLLGFLSQTVIALTKQLEPLKKAIKEHTHEQIPNSTAGAITGLQTNIPTQKTTGVPDQAITDMNSKDAEIAQIMEALHYISKNIGTSMNRFKNIKSEHNLVN